jgi:hypothetical protein
MRQRKRPSIPTIISLGLLLTAIVKELRQPAGERTWHGRIAGFVPYDLRRPTVQRFRETVWNPDGPLIVGQPFGVGWWLNPGRLFARRPPPSRRWPRRGRRA